MVAVHDAALVAPYGGESVRIEAACFETVGSISEAKSDARERKHIGSMPGVGGKEQNELHRLQHMGIGGVHPSPLAGEGLGMRGGHRG